MEQYQKNLGVFTQKDFEKIRRMRVLLVGLGGLGGYIANGLVRLGIDTLILVDHDVFELSNLNRQLFSSHINLGKPKVDVVRSALKDISPQTSIIGHVARVDSLHADVFDTIDIIIDAVDNIETKCYLETLSNRYKKPLLHGAIGGWYGQIGIVLPDKNLVHEIYGTATIGLEEIEGSPTFTPAVVANLMVTEFVKFVVDKDKALINKIMMIDLRNHDYQILVQDKAEDGSKKGGGV